MGECIIFALYPGAVAQVVNITVVIALKHHWINVFEIAVVASNLLTVAVQALYAK